MSKGAKRLCWIGGTVLVLLLLMCITPVGRGVINGYFFDVQKINK